MRVRHAEVSPELHAMHTTAKGYIMDMSPDGVRIRTPLDANGALTARGEYHEPTVGVWPPAARFRVARLAIGATLRG